MIRQFPLVLLLSAAASSVAVPALDPTVQVKQVPPEQAVKLVREGAIAVDVRSFEEWQAGHLKGARHVPVTGIADNAFAALPDKDANLLLYCRSGGRANRAGQILAQLGYSRVHVLQPGGFAELAGAGLPTQ